MSASLVGSEMCIRDRRSPPQLCHDQPGRFAPAQSQATTTKLRGLLRRAVSYTHLTLPTICSV
eukprot:9172867-Alexandrium_andersonii.AAC.1